MEKCNSRNRKTESEQNRMNHRTDDSVVVLSFTVCVYISLFICEREQVPKFALLFFTADWVSHMGKQSST